jgi:hypothetical protein
MVRVDLRAAWALLEKINIPTRRGLRSKKNLFGQGSQMTRMSYLRINC